CPDLKTMADSGPRISVRFALREGMQLIEVSSYVRSPMSSN
ncbi:MAG: hypothetical protein QOJ42_5734, partial [Acidobacteriaceae bacterium]|nr:hypothetical protein [Acidobacteriaceae bacterium]